MKGRRVPGWNAGAQPGREHRLVHLVAQLLEEAIASAQDAERGRVLGDDAPGGTRRYGCAPGPLRGTGLQHAVPTEGSAFLLQTHTVPQVHEADPY